MEAVSAGKGDRVDQRAIEDRIEIGELLARYERGVDSKDWDLWRSVFTPDAYVDCSSAGAAAGSRDEVAACLARRLSQTPMTQHLINNVEIEFDGDRAKVRALVFNPMHLPGIQELSFCGTRYHHDLVRMPEGWKSERLRRREPLVRESSPTLTCTTRRRG